MKAIVLEIYNKKLKKRSERKKLIFEHGLLDYRKNVMSLLDTAFFMLVFCSKFTFYFFIESNGRRKV